jgi:hypothetical protein
MTTLSFLAAMTPARLHSLVLGVGLVGATGVVLAFFILAVVMTVKTRAGGWIACLIVSGLLSVGMVGIFVVAGIHLSAKKRAAAAMKASSATTRRIASKDGSVSFELPGDWVLKTPTKETTFMLAGSDLSHQFVMLIRRDKEDFHGDLEAYDQRCIHGFLRDSPDGEVSPAVTLPVGSYPAIRHTFSGTVQDTNIVYHHAAVDTPDAYFEIMAWTTKSRAAASSAALDQIIDSFTVTP